ncbi:MAG: RagB/SusD family nutrient uptake outer membrane protein [Hymenobacter sp.]
MLGFFGLVYQNAITTATPNAVNMWSTSYALINQANVTIAGVQGAAKAGIITAADASIYEGELRFLRALAHHELVINFSKPYTDGKGANLGVPYRDFAINTTEGIAQSKTQDRGTVTDDYTKILADLDFAENNLPASRIIKNAAYASVTRATKGLLSPSNSAFACTKQIGQRRLRRALSLSRVRLRSPVRLAATC